VAIQHQWSTNGGGKSGRKKPRKSTEGGVKSQAKSIVAAVRQYHEEEAKTKQKENEHEDAMRQYIMINTSNVAATAATPAAIPLSTPLSLNRILKHSKKNPGSP
jgi:hypothetical protein